MSEKTHWYALTMISSSGGESDILVRKDAIMGMKMGPKSTELWLGDPPWIVEVAEEPADYDVGAGMLTFRKRDTVEGITIKD